MLRIAVYVRVSTEQDGQRNSLENQKSFFEKRIAENPDWELYGIFADEGVSGTALSHRKAFSKMLEQARNHAFDLIVTKEVSRFARNTVDTLSITRELRTLGIGVLFVNDAIDTRSGDGEFRLAIMASVAQEESRKTSERVRFGMYRQMEEGYVFARSVYGYDLHKGVLTVNPQQAPVVQRIFTLAANGHSCVEIAKMLKTEQAVLGPYMKEWKGHTVRKILRNEKYCGDLIQRKTYIADHLTHQSHVNHGQVPTIKKENHHLPLVTRELFARANLLTARKEKERVLCEKCGEIMRNKGKDREGRARYYCNACKRSAFL